MFRALGPKAVGAAVSAAGSLTLFAHSLSAGVVLDGSFGTHGALPGPNFMITAPMGRLVNTNLFQSFSQFNLNSSQSATFTGPSNIQNILARVTNGSPSSIDGTIDSDIHGANLFFMNPAGVLFGKHAQLDVSGSFAVTTANYLKLVGGGRFNANLGGQDTLTSAPVSAFGFLNQPPAPISISGSNSRRDSSGNIIPGPGLNIPPRESFSVVAGDITMNTGTIAGPGSRVNLVSVRSPGEVQLDATAVNSAVDVTQFTAMGRINLSNLALVDTSGPSGGPVVIRGGNLYLNNSQISSQTTGSIEGGAIDIALLDDLQIVNVGSIVADTLGVGKGGNLSVHAGSLSIDGSANPNFFTGIFADSGSGATGNAGNLTITVDQALSIVGGGQISAAAFSSGKGGNLSVHAGSLSIDGSAAPGFSTGIFADTAGSGNAGDVSLTVDQALSIVGGGQISAAASSSGNGGNLSVHAGSLSIDGSASSNFFTGISSASNPGATGDAGNVTITVDQALSIVGGGQISAATFSSGKGGDLTIHAGSLSIDGSAAPGSFTGIFADTAGSGNAGDVSLTVDQALSIVGGGQISAATFSSGSGGNLSVHAGSLSIDGPAVPSQFTGITAETQGSGNAGNLIISVDQALSVAGGGEISVDTFSSGNGGNLSVHAGSLSIDGSASSTFFTGISASSDSGATGNAGDLAITVDQALSIVAGGQISAATFSSGKGGDLTIHAGSLSIDGSAAAVFFTGISSASSAGATGDAGNATITVDQALSIVGGGQISAATFSSGNGGNLSVHAGSLSIDGPATPLQFPGIDTEAFGSGNAGNATITVDQALSIVGGGQISAATFSSGHGGNLSVHAGSLSIDGSAVPSQFTGITAETQGSGNAGDLTITVDQALGAAGHGQVSAASFTSAAAGSVQLSLGVLRLDSGSSISSANTGSGTAGSVVIDTTGSMKLTNGSSISTLADVGDAGSIELNSGGVIRLRDGSSITASAGASGGNIHITAPDLFYASDSSITARGGSNGGIGNGGNITIDPQFIVLKDSLISASAPIGVGGNVNLVSSFLFISGGDITATGTATETAPTLDLGAELITLPVSLLSVTNQLQERCTALLRGDFSSFILVGRGGTEPAPEELQEEF